MGAHTRKTVGFWAKKFLSFLAIFELLGHSGCNKPNMSIRGEPSHEWGRYVKKFSKHFGSI
ncbi:hypothetical protein GCM10010909_11050 [Acidocella aquatica]|uniref:Uncharacterized protein n=1 Tax=Acidocella aquatica TaxID=1922313 RepID=A0ABQ6A8M6_9PROT|nr:hypothetical protein GCM10010909_11050 [Acidocella aquatica]